MNKSHGPKIRGAKIHDGYTFKGVILAKTDGGAFLILQGTHKAFVKQAWAAVAPEDFEIGQEVEITLSRAVAREKGFLVVAGPTQGRLL